MTHPDAQPKLPDEPKTFVFGERQAEPFVTLSAYDALHTIATTAIAHLEQATGEILGLLDDAKLLRRLFEEARGMCDSANQRAEAAESSAKAAMKDAGRYRFLRENGNLYAVLDENLSIQQYELLDEAIDKAIDAANRIEGGGQT